jgi:hypothetical protein
MPGFKIGMVIGNNRPQYRPQVQSLNTLVNVATNVKQVPRIAIGGAMIGRIQFAKSGCSSCGK